MRSFWAVRANPSYSTSTQIHPALSSFADECCATLARLLAYVGTLALLAIVSIHLWDQLPADERPEASAKPGWSVASRSHPAFAVSQFDLPEKTEAYEILRHPQGGRKDVFRWAVRGEKPVAELEIYRPGDGARSCLGFIKRIDQPLLQLSGWSCQGDTLPARRAAIGCILSRLMLLTAGNDPKLAELFARAELKRASCAPSATSAPSADWVTGAENPLLRGTL
jgi:hypothetical protein